VLFEVLLFSHFSDLNIYYVFAGKLKYEDGGPDNWDPLIKNIKSMTVY
jgi:hypothetical protein